MPLSQGQNSVTRRVKWSFQRKTYNFKTNSFCLLFLLSVRRWSIFNKKTLVFVLCSIPCNHLRNRDLRHALAHRIPEFTGNNGRIFLTDKNEQTINHPIYTSRQSMKTIYHCKTMDLFTCLKFCLSSVLWEQTETDNITFKSVNKKNKNPNYLTDKLWKKFVGWRSSGVRQELQNGIAEHTSRQGMYRILFNFVPWICVGGL